MDAVIAHLAGQDAAAGHSAEAAARGLHPGNVLGPARPAPGHSVILSHGRFEQRLRTVLGQSSKGAGLQSVIRIIRTTRRGGKTGKKSGEPTLKTHYYPSSFPPDAEVLAAHNLCLLREPSGKVLRDHLPQKSIRSKRKRAALDPDFRADLLASISHNFRA